MATPRFEKSVIRSVFALLALLFSSTVPAASAGPVHWNGTVTVRSSGAAWGRMLALDDGAWLMVYTVFPAHAPTQLRIARSNDNARHWKLISSVTEKGRKLDNGNLIQLADGSLLLTMRSVIDGKSYRLPVYRSGDEGVRWKFLSTIAANEHPQGKDNRGLWEPTFNRLQDGLLSVLYADETLADASPAYSQVISQRVSSDGGASWGPASHVVWQAGGGKARPGMPVMTRMNDGRYILVFEACSPRMHCNVHEQISIDGVHWPAGLGMRIRHQRCGPYILSSKDGRLWLTSCQNEISYSNDDGAVWKTVNPPAWSVGFKYSWPAIYQTGTHEIAVVNGGDNGSLKIRFGRLVPSFRDLGD